MNNEKINQPEQPKESWLVGLIFIAIVIFFVKSCSGTTDNKDTKKSDDYFFACAAAQKEVKEELKAPSSAKFPVCSKMEITNVGDTWTIQSYVEAQNSFGVLIKTNFTAKIKILGKEKYSVISVKVD